MGLFLHQKLGAPPYACERSTKIIKEGHPPPLTTRAKRSKYGSFGDEATSTCLRNVNTGKKRKTKMRIHKITENKHLKSPDPWAPPGPEGSSGARKALRGPEEHLRGPEGPSGAP